MTTSTTGRPAGIGAAHPKNTTKENTVTTAEERFRGEIQSIIPAAPGWQVHVRREELDRETKERTVEFEGTFPVAAWAMVKRYYLNAGPSNEVEPVFYDGSRLVHETAYRWMYSDIDPEPGQPKVTVRCELQAPTS
ncbi:MAG: hypothetical protein JWO67_1956 [Streptosporangiaceae bacterium]|nr:hypothetical protein [Streptosporangiaceae bacterium]